MQIVDQFIRYSIQFDVKFTDCVVDIYYFYPDGIWDEDKLTLEEAEKQYPKDKFIWIESVGENQVEVTRKGKTVYQSGVGEPWWKVVNNKGKFEIWELGTDAFGGADYIYKVVDNFEEACTIAQNEIT